MSFVPYFPLRHVEFSDNELTDSGKTENIPSAFKKPSVGADL